MSRQRAVLHSLSRSPTAAADGLDLADYDRSSLDRAIDGSDDAEFQQPASDG